ncbi:MAG: prolipoprotein diacylglyceryl transferase [Desulfarculaceae bacterium]|jgi:hypothetical protein
MYEEIFILALACLYGFLLLWACRHLPGERWQIAATIPVHRNAAGQWQGVNLTFYGLLTASGVLAAAILMLVMLGSVGVDTLGTLIFITPLLSVCIPASRLVARWVEKKPATSTIAGANFIGMILSPWLVLAARECLGQSLRAGFQVPVVMAALITCYAIGEGMGRLACVSFGCCYGKPLSQCGPWVRRFFQNRNFVFQGDTKKISYESGLQGQPVVPIQVLTSAIYLATGLACLYLFLKAWFSLSLILGLVITQGWRAYSETLRADFRGGGRLTAYQWMALAAIPYGILIAVLFPLPAGMWLSPDLSAGIELLWNPAVLLFLQGLWLALVFYSGRSKVTSATIQFHVLRSEI